MLNQNNLNEIETKSLFTGNFSHWRGISSETLQAHKIIFEDAAALSNDPNYANQNKETGQFSKMRPFAAGAAKIPYNDNSFMYRNLDPNDSHRYNKSGNALIFNLEAISKGFDFVFIVEGALDALSIIELKIPKVSAIAIQSASTTEACTNLILDSYLKLKEEDRPRLILALDNDKAGHKATKEIREIFQAYNISFREEQNLSGDCKDPNEFLNKNRTDFEQLTKKLIESASLGDCLQGFGSYVITPENYFKELTLDSTPIVTCFDGLNAITGHGGLLRRPYFLGGISSSGKSAFSMQLATEAARSGYKVLYVTLEMEKREFISRQLCRLSFERDEMIGGINQYHLKLNEIEKLDSMDKFETDNKYFHFNQIFFKFFNEVKSNLILLKRAMSITEIYNFMRNYRTWMKGHGFDLLFIDYIQILDKEDQDGHKNPDIGDKTHIDNIVKAIQKISADLNVCVWALSSFNRNGYSGTNSTLSDFKESGNIEFSAEGVFALDLQHPTKEELQEMEEQALKNSKEGENLAFFNKKFVPTCSMLREYYEDKFKLRWLALKVLKNRHGRQDGKIWLSFEAPYFAFSECSNHHGQEFQRVHLEVSPNGIAAEPMQEPDANKNDLEKLNKFRNQR